MMSLNLHAIVRRAINANHPDQSFAWYRSVGQSANKGIVEARFAQPVMVFGSFQSDGDSALDHSDLAGKNTFIRRLYLYADRSHRAAPLALLRSLSRSGDYFKDAEGQWWYSIAVLEDFSHDGWVCLRVQLQTKEPRLTLEEDGDGEG